MELGDLQIFKVANHKILGVIFEIIFFSQTHV